MTTKSIGVITLAALMCQGWTAEGCDDPSEYHFEYEVVTSISKYLKPNVCENETNYKDCFIINKEWRIVDKKKCEKETVTNSPMSPTDTCDSGSIINPRTFNHIHTADDFLPVQAEGGCVPCGNASALAAAEARVTRPGLFIRRVHRYRDVSFDGSFGPGVFQAFDTKFYLSTSATGERFADYFDPQELNAHRFVDGPWQNTWGLTDVVNGEYVCTQNDFSKGLRLYDVTGTVTADQASAATAVLTLKSGEKRHFQIVTIAGAMVGRIVKYEERDGSTLLVSYRYQPGDDLGGSPSRLWQIQTVTDAYGRQAVFAYGDQQQSGRWAVSQISLPGGRQVLYGYTDGYLSRVQLANGDVATFTRGYDTAAEAITVTYDDPAAAGEHRRKKAFLTTIFTLEHEQGSVFPQSAQLIRVLVNGDGEPSYFNASHPVYTAPYIYEGAGKLRYDAFYLPGDLEHRRQYATKWSIQPSSTSGVLKYEDFKVTLQSTYATDSYKTAAGYLGWAQSAPSSTQDREGLKRTYVRDQYGNIASAAFPDGTKYLYSFNEYQQPTVEVDRLGRAIAYAYDTMGNVTAKTVGLRWNAVANATETTADTAVWSYAYFAAGHPHQGLLAAEVDPAGNRTDYAYNERGFLVSVTQPPDVAGGARAVTSYMYNDQGLVTQISEPGSQGQLITSYGYDLRDRLVSVTYADGSVATTTYGTGPFANLVVAETDRNGHQTVYTYDQTGRRRSKSIVPAGATTAIDRTEWAYKVGSTIVNDEKRNGSWKGFVVNADRQIRQIKVSAAANKVLTTTNGFDAKNRKLYEQDPYGRRIYFSFDGNNRVVRKVRELVSGAVAVPTDAAQWPTVLAGLSRQAAANPDYVIEDVAFDAQGQAVQRFDGRGIKQTTTYDLLGRMTKVTEAVGTTDEAVTTFAYDTVGNRVSLVDPRGVETAWTYSGRNLVISESIPDVATVPAVIATASQIATRSTTYTLSRKVATVTDFRGNTTTMTYGGCCDRLVKVTDPLGFETTYGYDFVGSRTVVRDANGLVTTTAFDALRRPVSVTNGVGEVTLMQYDNNVLDGQGLEVQLVSAFAGLGFGGDAGGDAVMVTNPANETKLEIRDALGRVLRGVDGNGHATTMTYDAIINGLVAVSTQDAVGAMTSVRADGRSQVRQRVDALGKTTTLAFDSSGNRVSVRDPLGVGQDCVFDNRNREIRCVDTAGGTMLKSYDANGNVVSETDQLAKVTTRTFDARNRKTAEVDRLGGATAFAYDRDGNVLSIVDAEGKITGYAYDVRGLLTQETFPAGQQTPGTTDRRSYTYDPGRRLATRTDQAGVVTTYQYDAANRLVARQYPDAVNDTFGYDSTGRLTTAVSARYGSTVRRFYTDNGEHAGRLTREEQVIGGTTYTVGYAYSADNQPAAVTYPDGTVLGRSFTARKELAQVTLGGGLVANRSYDDAGRLVSTTLGNGLTETRTYVPNDHLVASIVTPGVTQFTYSYDAAKRKTTEDDGLDPLRNQAFGYDPAGRLTSWQRDGQESQNWQLSLVGDWQSTTRNGATETRTHSDVHEATSLTTAGVTTPLLYDQKGNLTQDQDGRALTWDVENRLFQARDASNGILGSYSYDALGRRIGKALGDGTVTIFIHDGARVVVEITGSTVKRFAHGSYIDEVLAFDVSTVRSFVSANHLYSPVAVTSAAGDVVERFRYDAYGKQTVTALDGTVRGSAAAGLGRGFTGYVADSESGLCYARNRMYSPEMGRFVSRDPWRASVEQEEKRKLAEYLAQEIERAQRDLQTAKDMEDYDAILAIRAKVSELNRVIGQTPLTLHAVNAPESMDGYQDGMSLYSAYFIPNAVDPTGMLTRGQCVQACKGGRNMMSCFCRKIRDARLRALCWAASYLEEPACVAWCYWWY